MWRRRMMELGITVRHDLRLARVSRGSGRRLATFVHELTNDEVVLEADHVIAERGMRSVCDLYDDLRPTSVNDGELDLERFAGGLPQAWPAAEAEGRMELYRIGDASASRDIHAAIFEAFRLCRVL